MSLPHRLLGILLLPLSRSQPRRDPVVSVRIGDSGLGIRTTEKTPISSANLTKLEESSGCKGGRDIR